MTQLSLIPPQDRSTPELRKDLIAILSHGGWRHREDLALQLNVSVRKIRDAASQSNGQIVSGQQGLRLTVFCDERELDDALARLTSQIHEMMLRGIQIRDVWEAHQPRKTA